MPASLAATPQARTHGLRKARPGHPLAFAGAGLTMRCPHVRALSPTCLVYLIHDASTRVTVHPCLRCGACCSHYRASFYWAEADDAMPGGVPVELTEVLTPHLRVMRGTNQPAPRCIALQGDIGHAVLCSIHPRRASVCREYPPSYEDGTPNPRCDEARAAHGLSPLSRDDWTTRNPDDDEPDQTPPRWPRAA